MASQDLLYRFLGVDAGAGAQFDRMATKTAALGKSSAATLASLKRLAIGAGAVSAVIGVESVKAAANYQTALTRINTQANGSLALVEKYRVGILKMTAAVATSPTALAQAAFHVASVGQKSLTAAQQLGVLKIAAEGAKVGGADLTDVTNALAASIVSNIKGVKNYSQAMGVLNSTVGAGDMTMQNLADALSTGVLAAAKVAGLSIQDVGAALAVFGDNAIRGSTAGQRLSRVIMLMQAPSSTAVKALKSIGLSQTSLASDLRKPNGLVVALTDLQGHLKASGLTAVQQAQVIAEAFGKSRGAMNVELLLNQLTRLGNKQKIIGQDSRSFQASWAAYTKTFQFQYDQMRAAVEKLGIEIGQKLLPDATKLVNYVTHSVVPAFSGAAHWIERNSGLVKTLARLLLVSVVAWKAYRLWTIAASAALKLFGVQAVTTSGALVGSGGLVAGLKAATAAGYGWLAVGRAISMTPVALAGIGDRSGNTTNIKTGIFNAFGAGASVDDVKKSLQSADSIKFYAKYYHDLVLQVQAATGAEKQHLQTVLAQTNAFAGSIGILGKLRDAAFSASGGWDALARSIAIAGANAAAWQNSQGYGTGSNSPFRDPGHPGATTSPKKSGKYRLPSISIAPVASAGSVPSVGKSAAAVLHITAKKLTQALANGLLDGWQGFALTVRESLSTGTQHLLEQLGKQFEAIQKRMTTLVENAKTKLHDALTNERSYVQQMMSDAGLGNVPTVDSGYTGQTTRLTSIGAFLGSQAKNYALFDRLLRRLGHSGLSKALVSQIAQMGPTQGIQYAQQILANPGQIAQINAYQKQIARSAKAIGQDQYGSQVAADRKNLRRQTQLQERMAHRLDHLARDIGREVAANVHPGKGGVSGKPSGLSVHEAKQIERDLNKLDRLLGKKK